MTKNTIQRLLLICFLFVTSVSSNADNEQVWQHVEGSLRDISSNGSEQIFAISDGFQPMRWDNEQQRWRYYSGTFKQIFAAEQDWPWVLDEQGQLYRFNGLWWEIKQQQIADVAANAKGDVYILKKDGEVLAWYPLRNEWQNTKSTATKIATDQQGTLWIIDKQSILKKRDGKTWLEFGEIDAIDLSVDNDEVTVVNRLGEVWRLNLSTQKRKWKKIQGLSSVRSIAVLQNNLIWAVNREGQTLTNQKFTNALKRQKAKTLKAQQIKAAEVKGKKNTAPNSIVKPIIAPEVKLATNNKKKTELVKGRAHPNAIKQVDPNTISTSQRLVFIDTRAVASLLAIGGDGSVFGVASGGSVQRWSNGQHKFNNFPGALARIAVDSNGNPWGISSLGRVFKHNGRDWQQFINVTASDIAIGYDGTVILADSIGRLFKLQTDSNSFKQITGSNNTLIAVAPNDIVWSIRNDKLVQRCESFSCDVFSQRAQSIAIGPDSSVYIVSDINKLMLFSEADSQFTNVDAANAIEVEQVAVGPNGYPWLVDNEDRVFASQFFDRDETNDINVALTTSETGTKGQGTSAEVISNEVSQITFSKNFKFRNVINTVNIGGGDFNILEVGNDGSIWASIAPASPPSTFEKFSASRNRFIPEVNWFSSNNLEAALAFAIASNGDFWAVTGADIYRVRNKTQVKKFTFISGSYEDITIGGDDTVYVMISNKIYYKLANQNTFKLFSSDTDIAAIAAGEAGELWAINSSNQVLQWDGKQFANRPVGKTQSAATVKVGYGGTVYITDLNVPFAPLKWNATNNSFDQVNNSLLSNGGEVAVEDDGRLWLMTETDNTIKRVVD